VAKMPSSSRIVFSEDVVGASPWRPEAIEGDRRNSKDRRSATDRRAAEETPPEPSYEDGMRDGRALGLEQARRESAAALRAQLQNIAEQGDQLLGALTAQLASIQESAAHEITMLAVEIARSAVGVALRVNPELIVTAVTDALALITDENARPTIRVNPADAGLLTEHLTPLLSARGAQLMPDQRVARGGCLIDTSRASVDATLQTRWQRSIAALGIDDNWVQT
jgi:flagellar assembly protein FliH